MTRAGRLLSIAVSERGPRRRMRRRGVRIAELKTSPTSTSDKTVSVTGVVTDSYGISVGAVSAVQR